MNVRILTCLILSFGLCTVFGQQVKGHTEQNPQITINVPQQPIKIVEVERAPPVQPVVNVQKESSPLPTIAIIISIISAAASWFGIFRAGILAREKIRAKLYATTFFHTDQVTGLESMRLTIQNVGELPAKNIRISAELTGVTLQGASLLTNPWPVLGPGKDFEVVLDAKATFANNAEKSLTVQLTYHDGFISRDGLKPNIWCRKHPKDEPFTIKLHTLFNAVPIFPSGGSISP